MSSPKPQEGGPWRRKLLQGVVVAAVALMLWFAVHRETVPAIPEPVARAADSVVAHAFNPVDALPDMGASPQPRPLADGTFTVYLRPLQYDATDAQALAKVHDYYAAFAYRLRAVPGLRLVNDDSLTDFRVTISNVESRDAQPVLQSSEWVAKASVEILSGNSNTAEPAGTVYVLGMVGDAWRGAAPDTVITRGPLSGDCKVATIIPCSPAAIAERQVMALRKIVFPRDGSVQRELEARFLNEALPMRERYMAISDLLSMKVALSEEMLHAVVTRITRASDDFDRGNLLALLAGQGHQNALQPLIDVARYDPITSLRIQAMKMLAMDFPRDPSVRAALEQIVADKSNPTVQATAKEVISGLPGN